MQTSPPPGGAPVIYAPQPIYVSPYVPPNSGPPPYGYYMGGWSRTW
jgi:hypothetical protein